MSGHEQGSSQTFFEELTFNICYPLKKQNVVQKEILALTQLCYNLLHIQIQDLQIDYVHRISYLLSFRSSDQENQSGGELKG